MLKITSNKKVDLELVSQSLPPLEGDSEWLRKAWEADTEWAKKFSLVINSIRLDPKYRDRVRYRRKYNATVLLFSEKWLINFCQLKATHIYQLNDMMDNYFHTKNLYKKNMEKTGK